MRLDPTKRWSVPLIVFVTTLAAYGLLLPQMGFYWDDWPFVWIARFLGPKEFLPAFANVRPFLGPIFFLTTSLLPPVPIYWQILMLVIRFLSGLFAWHLFRWVWPQHKRQAVAAAFLFLVFPGYSQHWVAFTHINQEWIPFLFYLLSLAFTASALRNPQQFASRTALALLFLVLGVFPTEYFATLEPLRFLFISVILSEESLQLRQRFARAFKVWLPYLLVWLANLAWLGYYYSRGSYDSYDVEVTHQPLSSIQIVFAIGDAIWKAGLYLWAQVLVLVANSIRTPSSLLTLALIAIMFALFVVYFRTLETAEVPRRFAVAALLIGITGIVLGRVPSFAAGLVLKPQSSNDRFMISMMIGGSLFAAGAVEWIFRNVRIKTVIFALLVALGVGQQFFNANLFRRDWIKQQEFYSQLAWRIPAMQPGTLLLTDQLPLDYETDLSLTAPINWMYAPRYTRSTLPYALVFTEKRLGGSLPSLEPGTRIQVYLRTVNSESSTSKAIVFYMPKNGCLRVLSSQWNDEVTYARQSPYLINAIPLSRPELILANTSIAPALPFLAEPKHTWCYYFTRAELARQQGDWKQVLDLYREATSLGYRASDPLEWLVFIEAQISTGRIDEAGQLSKSAYRSDERTRKGLCELWKRVQVQTLTPDEDLSQRTKMLAELQCAP